MNISSKLPINPREVSDEAIMEAAGTSMRYCSVSAFNGTISTNAALTFDRWLECCETTWIPKVAAKLGVSTQRVCEATRRFSEANAHRESELESALSGLTINPGWGV